MVKKKKVSFLARVRVKRRVSFKAGKKRVSFTARAPSKRRIRISFRAKKRR
jgi:hypothetical protein